MKRDRSAAEFSEVPAQCYGAAERQLLLDLARRGLAERTRGGNFEPDPSGLSPALLETRACFVTLFRGRELRGCIGQVRPKMPLYQAVVHNACAAGLHDSRFEPVTTPEVPNLTVEVSVLSIPVAAQGSPDEIVSRLRPVVDGVLLEYEGSVVTFLPQVWEHLNNRERFMARLCQKAGWPDDQWRKAGMLISTYQTESFEDNPAG